MRTSLVLLYLCCRWCFQRLSTPAVVQRSHVKVNWLMSAECSQVTDNSGNGWTNWSSSYTLIGSPIGRNQCNRTSAQIEATYCCMILRVQRRHAVIGVFPAAAVTSCRCFGDLRNSKTFLRNYISHMSFSTAWPHIGLLRVHKGLIARWTWCYIKAAKEFIDRSKHWLS